MDIRELTENLTITEVYGLPLSAHAGENIAGLCDDSRNCFRNTVFVCVAGSKADGHDYASVAYSHGCRIFVAEHPLTGIDHDDVTVILVPNTRIALAVLSAAFYGYPAKKLHIIGVTGTKGKTTTCLLISHVLNANGIPTGYIGSNGVIFADKYFATVNTTPGAITLHSDMAKMVDEGITTLVMEVSSQALKYYRVYGIPMETVVFTNLHMDHIGPTEHPDFEDYKKAKRSLFTDYGASFMVYNADSPYADFIREGLDALPAVGISTEKEADYMASRVTFFRNPGALGVQFICTDKEAAARETPIRLPFPGEFSVYNALATVAVCRHYGLSFSAVANALCNARIAGRFETIEISPCGATAVIDYAHNGVSLQAALTALRTYNPHRLICLFGAVGGRTTMRRAELGLVASKEADFCILTEDNPDWEPLSNIIGEIASYFTADSCPYVTIPDRKKAIFYALDHAEAGDIILLAGKGHETYQIRHGDRIHFSEKEVIAEWLAAKEEEKKSEKEE